ncbi:MAG: DNA-directed RNA polymerase subunit omega [Clostridia bacterium]|nr:DNA-directed RNA polymerase subunit omega [Clostridia bacterium]
MIFEPSVEELTNKVGNNYELANLLSKRAKEIVQHPTEEYESGSKKAIQIAAEEIASGKVVMDRKED